MRERVKIHTKYMERVRDRDEELEIETKREREMVCVSKAAAFSPI